MNGYWALKPYREINEMKKRKLIVTWSTKATKKDLEHRKRQAGKILRRYLDRVAAEKDVEND